jgi:hypothetical protein
MSICNRSLLISKFTVELYDCNIALLQLNTIWVSCEGESPADVENIGPIKYIPKRGFPGYFYPYKNSEGYLSPVMAVHFERPRSKSDNEYWSGKGEEEMG